MPFDLFVYVYTVPSEKQVGAIRIIRLKTAKLKPIRPSSVNETFVIYRSILSPPDPFALIIIILSVVLVFLEHLHHGSSSLDAGSPG